MRLIEIFSSNKNSKEHISEAVHKLPLQEQDFDKIKEIISKPVPAIVARIYLQDVIVDDELDDQIQSVKNTDPGKDVRPLIIEWLHRVMPDEMYRFTNDVPSTNQKRGVFSPIHGYDPHQYSGSSFTGTQSSGNAYGRR